MKFDPTKPVQTVNGLKARRADINLKNTDYPLCFIIEKRDGYEEPETYTTEGKYQRDGDSGIDLINIPEKHVRYVNVHPYYCAGGDFRSSAEAAEDAAAGRIACVRIAFEEGQFDD